MQKGLLLWILFSNSGVLYLLLVLFLFWLLQLKLMSTVHQTQPMIQQLLSTNDFVGALDLIGTTQEVLTQELAGIHSFRCDINYLWLYLYRIIEANVWLSLEIEHCLLGANMYNFNMIFNLFMQRETSSGKWLDSGRSSEHCLHMCIYLWHKQ